MYDLLKSWDIVYLKEISFRGQWPMARVTDMFKEADDYSQTVKLLVDENKLKNNSS